MSDEECERRRGRGRIPSRVENGLASESTGRVVVQLARGAPKFSSPPADGFQTKSTDGRRSCPDPEIATPAMSAPSPEEEDSNEVTFVVEKDEVDALVRRIDELEGAVEPAVYHRVSAVVERYQEFGQLLDPHLEGWIAPLASVLRAQARAGDAADMVLVQRVSRVLHTFATVRGYKTVVKFFPHEARDLEPVVGLLVKSRDARLAASTLEEADELGTAWETRATLILWLSILVLIPFDLVTVDSAVEDAAAAAEAPPVVMRILRLCQDEYLSDPGIVRDRAAYLLARLLTRPDMPVALADFLDWATDALRRAGRDDATTAARGAEVDAETAARREQEATFLVPGVARALAAVFKLGTRGALLAVAERAWGDARDLAASPAASGSALVRQLACKLAQRIGLLFLKPKVVAWRYERGARSLVDTLAAKKVDGPSETPTAVEPDDSDDDDDVPEDIEEVIESLLAALRDKDTVVRWSAAKGLGRITARLPADFGDEVVGSILECFATSGSDATWHGACLALAELARRGLLLPARLPDAVPRVADALAYDVRRGPHSVGAHVRDAAAYVCWAFARAYAPEILAPHARVLAPSLLVTACFDREVNCRRAAAAAFQEAVGRLGAFPHGIDIVAAADYFALGSRANAYVEVADFVCGFDEYRRPMLEHLLDVKLAHWERATRELAGRALRRIARRDPAWTRDVALPALLTRALSPSLETRHGATVGAGEALLALRDAGEPLVDGQLAERVTGLVGAIEKARLYRGKGGEVMRAATCRYAECLAEVRQPLDAGPGPATGPKSLRSLLLASLEENLKHPTADIRDAAVAALGRFARSYMCGATAKANDAGARRLPAKLAATLRDEPNPAARRGAAAALGVMPAALLSARVGADADKSDGGEAETVPAWRAALDALRAATVPEEDSEARDAEARVCAAKAIAGVTRELLSASIAERRSLASSESNDSDLRAVVATVASEAMEAMLACAEDYCVDNRGDVGSWVREAAMEALPSVVAAAQASAPGASAGDSSAIPSSAAVVAALLKQASEKIDRVRAAAFAALVPLLRGDATRTPAPLAPLDTIPAREAILAATPEEASLAAAWAVPASAFEKLVPLIVPGSVEEAPLATYRSALVEGVVVSAGGVGDSLGKAAGGALAAALRTSPELQAAVMEELVALLRRRAGIDRVTVPALRVLDHLFSSGCVAAVAPPAPAPPAPIAADLVARLRAELKGSRDVAKLCLGVTVMCHLVALGKNAGGDAASSQSRRAEDHAPSGEPRASDDAPSEPCARTGAMQGALALLVNRYPRVRRVAAEQLYVTLLGMSDEDDPGLEAAADRLSETRWDAELSVVKPARNELYPMLGLVPPAAALVEAKGRGVKVETKDENESYAALVGSAGY